MQSRQSLPIPHDLIRDLILKEILIGRLYAAVLRFHRWLLGAKLKEQPG